MGYDWSAYLSSLYWTVGAIALMLLVVFAIGVRIGRHNVIDPAWGLGFCVVASITFAASSGHGYDPRRALLLIMVLVWGLRLAWHIGRRSMGKGEDPRYDELLSKAKGSRNLYALRVIYLLQGVLILFISLPIAIGMFEGGDITLLGCVGVASWALGLYFEATGDRQMSKFKSDPTNRGRLIDIGLWRYTRHPNYFGDACVWVGLFLLSAEHWPGILFILSPVVMVYLLANGSGKKVLERSMMKRPGYREYVERTSGFIPLPPRKSHQDA
jgi:steroid 5-alpha reductase family enzyme